MLVVNGTFHTIPTFGNLQGGIIFPNQTKKAVKLFTAPACPWMLLLLVGCCIVVHHLFLSLHAILQPLALLLPAAFAANCQPLPLGGLNTSCFLPFAAPIVGWLLPCCPPQLPAFVIARHHMTINALVADRFHHQPSTAAFRWSCHQPLSTFTATIVDWLL
jgi:hypothetical protein